MELEFRAPTEAQQAVSALRGLGFFEGKTTASLATVNVCLFFLRTKHESITHQEEGLAIQFIVENFYS